MLLEKLKSHEPIPPRPRPPLLIQPDPWVFSLPPNPFKEKMLRIKDESVVISRLTAIQAGNG